jgi:hypothetical protein
MLSSVPAHAGNPMPTLYTIHGHITDSGSHAAISGVGVTDGNQAVYTDATGSYALNEDALGVSVMVSASKLGYAPVSKTVNVVGAQKPVDFVMSRRQP